MIVQFFALLALGLTQQSPVATLDLVSNGKFATGDTSDWHTNAASFEVLNAAEGGFKFIARANFQPKAGGNPWDVVLTTPSAAAITKGRKITISAWMRSSTSSKVALNFEQSQQPFGKMISKEVTLTPVWKEYEAEGIADQDYAPGGAQMTIFLGYGAGTADFANIRVETLGRQESLSPVTLVPRDRLSNGSLSGWSPTGLESFTTISANQPKFEKAVRASFIGKLTDNPWAISLHAATIGAVKQGHTVYLRAWMRSPSSSKVSLIFEHASDPFTKPINSMLNLTPQWKEYRVAGIADASYGPGETQLTVFLNYGTGSVEIGDVQGEDIGNTPISSLPVTISYYGKPNSDAWRGPALARIEKYRKGDLTVQVLDSRGKPLKGATVQVEQVRQEFRFGTAASAQLIVQKGALGDSFRADLQRFFNTVTFENDLKWHQIEPEDYTQVDAATKWLLDRGFRIRGHNLVWGSPQFMPKGLMDMTNEQIVDVIHRRVTDMVTRFKGKVYLWDVVNEAAVERALWDRIGWDKFGDVYKWAREADPNVELAFNEYDWTEEEATGSNHRNRSIELTKMLIKQGAPLDVLGLQSHDEPPLTPMARVIEITNDLAKLGKKLEVTEYDLGVLDDKFHGEYMRDFLTAMYSVPQVQSFVMWGFWQGAHWRANQGGAMVRRDWSLRPAALIWEDLVRRQWSTHATLQTNATGTAKTRAFFGTLRVTATAHGKKVTKDVQVLAGKPATLTLKLAAG